MNEMIFMSKNNSKSTSFFALFYPPELSNHAFYKQELRLSGITPTAPKDPATKLIWKKTVESEKSVSPPMTWNKVPDQERDSHQPSTSLIWEILEANDSRVIPPPEAEPNRKLNPPTKAEEVEALRNTIPLEPSDYQPLLRLSHAVPTASVLRQEEWRLISTTISPFHYESDTGTGNQNYAVQLITASTTAFKYH